MFTDESLKAKIDILAESHVETYMSLYYRRNKHFINRYLRLIYDLKLELEIIKEFLERELLDREKHEVKEHFISAVLNCFED